MIRNPLYRRLGGYQRVRTGAENLASTRVFEPRTVQHVASRYTDWDIPAPFICTLRVCKLRCHYESLNIKWLDVNEQWIEKHVEGSGCDIMWGTMPYFAQRDWSKIRNTRTGNSVYWQRFEPATSRREFTSFLGHLAQNGFGTRRRHPF